MENMLGILFLIQNLSQVLVIVTGIIFIRCNYGWPSYCFLLGVILSFLAKFMQKIDFPLDHVFSTEFNLGEVLMMAFGLLGGIFAGLGLFMIAYKQFTLNKALN